MRAHRLHAGFVCRNPICDQRRLTCCCLCERRDRWSKWSGTCDRRNLSFASRFPSRASPLHPSSFGRRRSARRNALPPPRSIRTEARQATFARHSPTEEDGERVVLATDRPIGFLESVNQPRSINYPFTIIEMQLNRAGEGEGRMSLATKVMRTLSCNPAAHAGQTDIVVQLARAVHRCVTRRPGCTVSFLLNEPDFRWGYEKRHNSWASQRQFSARRMIFWRRT